LIIEGIHAMNPALTQGLPFARMIGVYICPFDSYLIPDKGEITSRDIRLMRRSLRDIIHRNTSIMDTVERWPSVRAGEERYIKPMKQYADFFFNSSFEYEICILKARILKAASALSEKELAKLKQYLPLDLLESFHSCENVTIPKESIFNEFYS
jgi:uridine kinase